MHLDTWYKHWKANRHKPAVAVVDYLLERIAMREKEMLNLPPVDDTHGDSPEDAKLAAALETLPMPRGVVLLFQPFVVTGLEHGYSRPVLTEGECGECGTEIKANAVTMTVQMQQLEMSVQCPSCGALNVLCYFGERSDYKRVKPGA